MASLAAAQQQQQQQASRVTASSAFSQALQSDPVRRLFNQPNIVIHAIPRTNSPTAFRMVRPSSLEEKSSPTGDQSAPSKPEVSIRVINSPSEEANEAENLLPSKSNGKSEILLVPVVRKRKPCGHFEPCESLVCPVSWQQYEDEDGLLRPLVAADIEDDDEIDAPVAKHCARARCDALSIDHDRCRAAAVRLYRCDRSSACDVCELAFPAAEARLEHKKCRRKPGYQHSTASPSDVFRYRMRQRELQMTDAARAKRSCEYLDPVTGFARTMEALAKNDELIIIPKMPPFPPKIVKPCYAPLSMVNHPCNGNSFINRISNSYNNNNSNNKNHNLKSILGSKRMHNIDRELTSEMISNIIASCQSRINSENQNDRGSFLPTKQIKLSDHGSLNGATVNIMDVPSQLNQSCINLTGLTNNLVKVSSASNQSSVNNVSGLTNNIPNGPSTINQPSVNVKGSKKTVKKPLLLAKQQQKQFIAKAGLQLTSVKDKLPQQSQDTILQGATNTAELPSIEADLNLLLPKEPFRVVPIAELKSEPSLLHQTHGLPKFCVVPDASSLQNIMSQALVPVMPKKKKKKKSLQKEVEIDCKDEKESLTETNIQKKNEEEHNQQVEENGQKDDTSIPTKTKKRIPALLPKLPSPVKFVVYRPVQPVPSNLKPLVNNIKPSTVAPVSNVNPSIATLVSVDRSIAVTVNKANPSIVTTVNNVNSAPVKVSPAIVAPVNVNPNIASSNLVSIRLAKKQKVRRKRVKKISKRFKFGCSYCPKHFTSIEYRRQHVALHENNPDFYCRLCERGFMNKLTMRKHQEAEHKPDEVRCEMCGSVLASQAELAVHVKHSTEAACRKCPECDEGFKSCHTLDLHMRGQHGFLVCALCKRQVTKSKMKRHLMLEHSLSKHRSETGFDKLTLTPGENDRVCELDFAKPVVQPVPEKNSSSKSNIVEDMNVGRRSSSRRRSSKDFFVCKVCERRFDSEKQYQIHLANNPMKFTPCPTCRKKFHRKTEYTEHSKTCNPDRLTDHFYCAEPKTKKIKSNLSSHKRVLKSDNISQNSIDQKQNEFLETNKCKELKINENEIVQKYVEKYEEDKEKEEFEGFEEVEGVDLGERMEEAEENQGEENEEDKNEKNLEDKNNLKKSTIKIKILNGLKQNSSDCLEMLNVKKSENTDVKKNNERALVLNNKQSQLNSDETTVFDKSAALSSIIQDHNYQVLQ